MPIDFRHPKDEMGDYIVGAHHEPLYFADPALKTAYQVYENVSEGTPVSPVFASLEELMDWLFKQGFSLEQAQTFIADGHCPSFVVRI
ncbi:M20 family metallopeptidase [Cupriavidus plantarum]|uniref:M20 family metallopeptidase n=1 Tax=Cupriavidus plantarum TaxID=942865 RepID=UPI0011B21FBA|nr:M20 family metallopeptidase [Cupriavidus plantarum]